MPGSVEIPFAVGESVWWIGHKTQERTVTCRECAGQKFITLIQGNCAQFKIDCACCSRGYDSPSGVIRETWYEHLPELVTLGDVFINGKEIRYAKGDGSSRQLDASVLFRTMDQCLEECVKRNAVNEKDRMEQAEHNLKSKRREMAWSVHYWQGQAKRLRDDLEACERRLDVCKAKACAKPHQAAGGCGGGDESMKRETKKGMTNAKLKVRVFHSYYGCESGCCGHVVEVEGKGEKFEFGCAYGEDDKRKWARELAEKVIKKRWPDCIESIDWDTMDCSEVSED